MQAFYLARAHALVLTPTHLPAADFEALSSASCVLQRVHAECEHLRAQALQEAERVRSQAYAEGFAQGEAQGRAAVAVELAHLALDTQRRAQALGQHLVELVLRATEQVLGRLPQSLRLRALVRRALAHLHGEAPITLHVATAAVSGVRQTLGAAATEQVLVRADPALGASDCRIETRFGAVDAGLPAQLAALQAALQNAQSQWLSQQNFLPAAAPPVPEPRDRRGADSSPVPGACA